MIAASTTVQTSQEALSLTVIIPVYNSEAILPALDEVAKAHGVSRMVVALAWLLVHPAKILPVIGSTNPQRIREATKAAELKCK